MCTTVEGKPYEWCGGHDSPLDRLITAQEYVYIDKPILLN